MSCMFEFVSGYSMLFIVNDSNTSNIIKGGLDGF